MASPERPITAAWRFLSNSGNARPGIRGFAEALRLDPRSWEAYYDRGIAHRDKRDFDEAMADLDRAILAKR